MAVPIRIINGPYKICILLFGFASGLCNGQIAQVNMKSFVYDTQAMNKAGVENQLLITEFYRQQNFNWVWLGHKERQHVLYRLLSAAPDYGLEEKDYQYRFLQLFRLKLIDLTNVLDSIAADIRITDAAIHFLKDVKNGNRKLSFSYDGLQYVPSDNALALLLSEGLHSGHLDSIVVKLEPKSKEYLQMKQMLKHWNNAISDSSFCEVKVTSNKVVIENINLLTKLQQLGVFQPKEKIDNALLLEKLIGAQKLLDVLSDGTLRSTTLAVLNVPLRERIEELRRAINYLRWLNEIRMTGTVALLNIPSAQLMIYKQGKLIFDSKIIAGKPSTPTATLSSSIKEVIVYPYWNVPHSIATRELLPRIQRNIGYLDANNYQVLNKQGKVVNPYTIHWRGLSASYFPYSVRQATGCDNALGILKFNFYNPFSMYLHDTPGKSLFLLQKRFFSHGCMRLEKSVELAKLLLKNKVASVENLINSCLKNQFPVTIQLEGQLPLMVFYSTAWYNEKGEVKFHEDVYRKNYF